MSRVGAASADTERRSQLEAWHREMAKLRAVEEAVAEGHRDGHLTGLLHLSMGGEALTTGVFTRLMDEDRVYSAHRPHSHFVAGGVDPRMLFAELAGLPSGLCGGRAGTMHLMSDRVVMATGIVGGTLPLAVGHALRMPEGAVVVVMFGDGAVQTGNFHESMNLAALWGVPVLFVCENNGWAEFSSREEHTTVGAVSRYGDLYGIPAAEIDGSDVEAVAVAASQLLEHVRSGAGPALLEAQIARMRPHYEGDWREQSEEGDPLLVVERTLLELGATEADIAEVREATLAEARALREEALSSANGQLPGAVEAHVYSRPLS
jgi:TPP-dependent pyruvate/acetoin dehydrogenase alpha subunit